MTVPTPTPSSGAAAPSAATSAAGRRSATGSSRVRPGEHPGRGDRGTERRARARRKRRATALVGVIAAVALAAGACSSGSGPDDDAAGGAEDTTTTTAEMSDRNPDGSCVQTVTSTIGTPVQVVVESGDVDCRTAVQLVDTYYNNPPTTPEGSGAFVVIGEWDCISTTAAEANQTGRLGSCESPEGRIVMREAPPETGGGAGGGEAVVDGELSLAPTGIGIAEWGAPRDEVVAAVTELLGEPEQVYENVDETAPDFDFHVQVGRYYTWEGLTLYFQRDTDGLTWYLFTSQRYDPAVGEFVTPDNPDLTTPDGIGLGSPASELFATYGPLQVWNCDYDTFDRTVAPATEGTEGTLITALDGYFFAVEGGTVTDISHAAGDERDFCY